MENGLDEDNVNILGNIVMKFLGVSLFIFFSMNIYGQNVRERFNRHINPSAPTVQELHEPVDLKQQIEAFINQVNKDSNNSKHILYVIDVCECDTTCQDYYFSMSYIFTSKEYGLVKRTHYFMIGENIVLLSATCSNGEYIFATCGIKTIETKDVDYLTNILLHLDGKNTFTYWAKKLTYCKKGGGITIKYYPPEEKIFSSRSFYPSEIPEYLHPDYIPPQLRENKEKKE